MNPHPQKKQSLQVAILGATACLFTLILFAGVDLLRDKYSKNLTIDCEIEVVQSTNSGLIGKALPHNARGYTLPKGIHLLKLPHADLKDFSVLSLNRADIKAVSLIQGIGSEESTLSTITREMPISERPLINKKVAFYLPKDSAATETRFLEINTDYSIIFQLNGWKRVADYTYTQRINSQILGYYFGIISILILVSLFIYFSSHLKAYLYYPIFLSFHAISILAYEGVYAGTALAKFDWIHPLLLSSIPLTVLFALTFLESFLDLKVSHPRTLRFLKKFKWVFYVLLLQVFLIPFPALWDITVTVQAIFVLIAAALYPTIAGIKALDGKAEHKLIFVTFIPHFIAVAAYMLQVLGWIEPDKHFYYKLLASTFTEMLLLSAALGLLIQAMRKQKESSDKAAIENLTRAVKAESNYNTELEAKVLERTNELENANQEKQRLLEIISHDLRAPMHSIVQYSEVSLDEEESFSKDDYRDILKDINYSSHSLYQLLENLLTWTKTNWNGVKPDNNSFVLFSVIEATLDIYRVPITEKSIHIEMIGDKNLTVFADKDMLNTLLRNVTSNALAHTATAGKFSIQWERVNEESVQIRIINEGPPIKREIADEISSGDPFDPSRKRNSKGLGLRLSKAISNLNDWDFKIEPVGEGTRVTFTIQQKDPLATAEPVLV